MSNLPNTSSSGGYLLPQTPYPMDDEALDIFLQNLIVGITGMPGALVRARWQTTIPQQPPVGTNWCAIGVISETPDDGPWIDYDPNNLVGIYTRHTDLEVLSTFYGPASKQNCALLRDGLAIPQNCEVLRANVMDYVSCGRIQHAPEFVNQQWIGRSDMTINLRRKVTRDYQTNYLAVAEINLTDDAGQVNDKILVPPGSPWSP